MRAQHHVQQRIVWVLFHANRQQDVAWATACSGWRQTEVSQWKMTFAGRCRSFYSKLQHLNGQHWEDLVCECRNSPQHKAGREWRITDPGAQHLAFTDDWRVPSLTNPWYQLRQACAKPPCKFGFSGFRSALTQCPPSLAVEVRCCELTSAVHAVHVQLCDRLVQLECFATNLKWFFSLHESQEFCNF